MLHLFLSSVFYCVPLLYVLRVSSILAFLSFFYIFFISFQSFRKLGKHLLYFQHVQKRLPVFFLTIQFTSNKLHTINNNKYWLPSATVASRIVRNRSAQFTPHIPHLERSVHYNRQAGDVARLGQRTSRDLRVVFCFVPRTCFVFWFGLVFDLTAANGIYSARPRFRRSDGCSNGWYGRWREGKVFIRNPSRARCVAIGYRCGSISARRGS